MTEDMRWKRRFSNYLQALQTLTEAVGLALQCSLTPFAALGAQAGPDA